MSTLHPNLSIAISFFQEGDGKIISNSDLYFHSATVKYLENYETTVARFEFAAFMDPGLGAKEDVKMMVQLLAKFGYMVWVKYLENYETTLARDPGLGAKEDVKMMIQLLAKFSYMVKYLENYETTVARFEVAAFMDPGLGAKEDVKMMVQLLAKFSYMVWIKVGNEVTDSQYWILYLVLLVLLGNESESSGACLVNGKAVSLPCCSYLNVAQLLE